MIKNNLPLWFRQISYQKNERIITNGLTIPYLIGIYQICNQPLNHNSIRTLIFEIKESILEECAVLQRCPYIRQYVIGVDDRQYCEHYMKKQIRFENSVGQSSLFVTQNANELGNNLDRIVELFNNIYDNCISNAEFSWNNETKNWEKFTEYEIDLIKKGQ